MGYPSQAVAALGTKFLKESPAGSGEYVAVAEVMKLKGPSETMATIDVTNLDSQGTKEFIQGLHDGGTVTFTVNYNQGHEALRVFGPPLNYKIQLPDDPTTGVTLGNLTFKAVVTKFDRSFDETAQLTVDLEFQVSGYVTFTADE